MARRSKSRSSYRRAPRRSGGVRNRRSASGRNTGRAQTLRIVVQSAPVPAAFGDGQSAGVVSKTPQKSVF